MPSILGQRHAVGAAYGPQFSHPFCVLDPGGVGGVGGLAAWTRGLSQTSGSW